MNNLLKDDKMQSIVFNWNTQRKKRCPEWNLSILLRFWYIQNWGFSGSEMFEKPGSYLFQNKIWPNMEQVVCSLQGILGQAKNGDELFCEEKFLAAHGKAPTCSQGALISFL